MKKMFKTLQLIWLIAAIASLVAAVINAANHKTQEAIIFIAITFIGALMFVINKKRIKSLSDSATNNQSNVTLS